MRRPRQLTEDLVVVREAHIGSKRECRVKGEAKEPLENVAASFGLNTCKSSDQTQPYDKDYYMGLGQRERLKRE